MRVARGKVVGDTVMLEDPLPDGASVMVVEGADEPWELDETSTAEPLDVGGKSADAVGVPGVDGWSLDPESTLELQQAALEADSEEGISPEQLLVELKTKD